MFIATPPFINAIEQKLVEPVFTVWLDKKGGDAQGVAGGLLVYGEEYYNNAHCGSDIKYVPLSEAKYWYSFLHRPSNILLIVIGNSL
jgi:hypothetical protein